MFGFAADGILQLKKELNFMLRRFAHFMHDFKSQSPWNTYANIFAAASPGAPNWNGIFEVCDCNDKR